VVVAANERIDTGNQFGSRSCLPLASRGPNNIIKPCAIGRTHPTKTRKEMIRTQSRLTGLRWHLRRQRCTCSQAIYEDHDVRICLRSQR
jgi:hypothetical protein